MKPRLWITHLRNFNPTYTFLYFISCFSFGHETVDWSWSDTSHQFSVLPYTTIWLVDEHLWCSSFRPDRRHGQSTNFSHRIVPTVDPNEDKSGIPSFRLPSITLFPTLLYTVWRIGQNHPLHRKFQRVVRGTVCPQSKSINPPNPRVKVVCIVYL